MSLLRDNEKDCWFARDVRDHGSDHTLDFNQNWQKLLLMTTHAVLNNENIK